MGWGLAGTGNSSAAVAAVVVAPLKCTFLLVNSFLRDWVENERSQRDTTAILIVRMLRRGPCALAHWPIGPMGPGPCWLSVKYLI